MSSHTCSAVNRGIDGAHGDKEPSVAPRRQTEARYLTGIERVFEGGELRQARLLRCGVYQLRGAACGPDATRLGTVSGRKGLERDPVSHSAAADRSNGAEICVFPEVELIDPQRTAAANLEGVPPGTDACGRPPYPIPLEIDAMMYLKMYQKGRSMIVDAVYRGAGRPPLRGIVRYRDGVYHGEVAIDMHHREFARHGAITHQRARGGFDGAHEVRHAVGKYRLGLTR